jgi:diguanylate cyclase (GGDEF)-like protein
MDHDAAKDLPRLGTPSPRIPRAAPAPLEPLLKAALECAAPGMILLDGARRVRLVTQGAASLLGLPLSASDVNLPVMRLLARSCWLDQPALHTLAAAFKVGAPEPRKVLLTLPHPTGTRVLALDMQPIPHHGQVVTLHDVTQSEETQNWLLDQASCDPVTGLWNKQHFLLRLRDRLESAGDGAVSVMLVVLKRLRQVTETHGIDAGDKLLRLVASRLRSFLREDDVLARFPSGEFAILVGGLADRSMLAMLGERIAALVARPFMIEGQLVTTSAYLGAACTPDDGDQPDILVANAGLALSSARAEANGQMRFFEPKLTETARRRRQMEADLRSALAHNEMEVYFQPQIAMATHCIDGFEALLRWRSPERGMVSPTEFIPLAEEIGMIEEIGEWVLYQACREAMRWPDGIVVAVNASPLQMEASGFAACVARVLKQTGLPGNRLEIEVTENLLLHHGPAVTATLRDLRALGVRLVLDDFGTGYANLSQLARFHFDRIKIDRSFISAPDINADHAAIVRAIAALGLSLGVPTTAEGVETEHQLRQVRDDGCTSVQGYWFSKPLPIGALDAFLARHGKVRSPARGIPMDAEP